VFVDRLAGEHPVDPPRDLRLGGEVGEQAQGLGIDAVLGVVEEDATALEREALRARGVRGEETGKRRRSDCLLVRGEGLPGGRADEGAHDCVPTLW